MKIMKIAFRLGDDQEWKVGDAIEYLDIPWIVVRWLENKGLGIAKPERIVQMDNLQYTKDGPPGLKTPIDLFVLTTIPEFVFDLRIQLPLPAPFFAIDHPDITVELPSDRSNLH